MATIKQKISLIKNSSIGLAYKLAINLHVIRYSRLKEERKSGMKIIVSLTSYGRRVTGTVYYSIVSILRQSVKPDKIVLYLDSWQWNDGNLPISLKRLKDYGLEVRYTDKKLKSYKKLVHALEDYPNETIITIDDDMYYTSDMIKRMIEAQQKDPTKVYCNYAHLITKTDDNKVAPYNDWIIDQKGVTGDNVFLLGVGSCIYRRELLHDDILNDSLYTKLAPNADDIWFFFMEKLKGTEREALSYSGVNNYPLDSVYQYTHNDASLNASNCGQSQNDVQFRNVMKHYGLSDKDIV